MNSDRNRFITFAGFIGVILLPLGTASAQPNPPGENRFSVEQVLQIGTQRYRHGCAIDDVWFTPDNRIVSAGGHRLRVWDSKSGILQNEVRDAMYSKAYFDGDSRLLVGEPLRNGVRTHTFRVVDINTGKQLAQWRHPTWVRNAAVGRDANFAVLANSIGTISIVDLKTGQECDRIESIGPKSNEGNMPAITLSSDSSRLAVMSRRNYVRFYSLAADGKVERLLSTIDSLSFHKIVFSTRADEVVFLGSRKSSLWNVRTGKQLIEWAEPGPNQPSEAVFAAAGRELAELTYGVVRVRDMRTGKELRQFSVNAVPRFDHIALSPDEMVLAGGGFQERVRLYDFKTGKEIRMQADAETYGPVESVAISDDGNWIASAEFKGTVSLWDGTNHWRRVVCPDDDIRSKYTYDTSAGPGFLAFLPGESKLLAGSGRFHNSVNLWDAATRDARFRGHATPIFGVATSRDGSIIASLARGGQLRIWDRSGTQIRVLGAAGNSVALSSDGKLVAASVRHALPQQGRNGIPEPRMSVPGVEIWNVQTGKLLRSMSDVTSDVYGIYSVTFSPDGRLLAGMAKDGLYVWDVATGERTRRFPVPQPEHEPFSHAPNRGCAFCPTQNIVAVPTGDGAVYFVDAEAKVDENWLLAVAQGHDGPVKSVRWRGDGTQIVSGGSDSTIIVWQVGSGIANQDSCK